MKRMFAPSKWCLDKLSGVYATRPSTGPHKLRECIPMTVLLRNRLKYALSGQEAIKICRDKSGNIKVDNKIRRDPRYPVGTMDVISIPKTGENFRIMYDVKGRFQPVRIDNKEASFKLCKVNRKVLGKNKIPYIVTHDGRTIRYPHPDIKKNDTVKLNLETGEIDGVVKFENGCLVFVTGGNNIGRVGQLMHLEKHPGSYEIVHIRDVNGESYSTRLSNVFCVGQGKKSLIKLPSGNGVRLSLIATRNAKIAAADDEE
jgi:small subunit ribosomal protein S4e|eukprot:Macronucleus_1990.p1 GENE.Macronucleus_1990~~Macronucleus_1990.p1  ORF type:complete len:258 (+),score=94.12 Macronucleus_1990:1-774(+)